MDINKIRSQFPALAREVNGNGLIYFDNTATSQTPTEVVADIVSLYEHTKANVHRGVHTLSQEATMRQEATRERVARYINASSTEEVIFTRGTTEAINLVAASMGKDFPDTGEIILTVMEHHSNIVPWQLAAAGKNITIRPVGINERGELDLVEYESLFNEKTIMAAFCHVSNVLGTVNPVRRMVEIAHSHGVPVLIDGAQASPHLKIDVQDLGCDFYAFSSHKMYGPTGIGILYGRKEMLEKMPPYQGGGEMIDHVTFEKTTFAELPFKFEAGTPDFIGIAAFSKALDFIEETGLDEIERHEEHLLEYATSRMLEIPDMKIYGTAPGKTAVISFNLGNAHPYDVGMLLDQFGIAIRTGHHCAQPLMRHFGIHGMARASFAVYNTEEEVDKFISALNRINKILSNH